MSKSKVICNNCKNKSKSNREFPCNQCIDKDKFVNKHIRCENCKYELSGNNNIHCFDCDLKHSNFEFKH